MLFFFYKLLKFRKTFWFLIKIGEFWTRIAQDKQTVENKIAKMRKCLTKFSRIFECGADSKSAKSGPLPGPASPVVARLSFEPGFALACVRLMLSVVSPLGAF